MIADGRYVATVDEVDCGRAAVIVEADGEAVAELTVSVEALPTAEEGTVLDVEIEDGELVAASADAETTAARRRRLRDRFDSLSERPPGREEDG